MITLSVVVLCIFSYNIEFSQFVLCITIEILIGVLLTIVQTPVPRDTEVVKTKHLLVLLSLQ